MRRYTVELIDRAQQPDGNLCIIMGEFDTEEAAVAYAKRIIDGSLKKLQRPHLTPVRLFAEWLNRGEGVRVRGRNPVAFRPTDYARGRAYSNC